MNEIKEVEKRLFSKIENKLGKVLSEIARDFDIVKDFSIEKMKTNEKELEHELRKELKWIKDNYDQYNKHSDKLDFNDPNLEADMKPFLSSIKDKYPKIRNEFKRRFVISLQDNPKHNKHTLGTYILSQMRKEEKIVRVVRDMKDFYKHDFKKSIEKEFNHDTVMETYNKLKKEHPEYDERKLLFIAFNLISESKNERGEK